MKIAPALFLATSLWAACSRCLAFTPANPVTVRVRIHDPDGLPVQGATAFLTLSRYGGGPFEEKQALTDKDGVATLKGIVETDYLVGAKKPGYYGTKAALRVVASDPDVHQYATGVQQFDLELKPIRNPIAMLRGGTGMYSIPLPSLTQPAGYDLEKGDWVAPWGKGVISDFVFQLAGHYTDRLSFELVLNLSFSNPNDGIQSFEIPADQASDFVFPYEAPVSGYSANRAWHFARTPTHIRRDHSDSIRYIFRVRTELNPDGTVKHALYGYLTQDIEFYPAKDTAGLSLNYGLNATGTRNLEVDKEHSVQLNPR